MEKILVYDADCLLDQFKEECAKCRVLCGHCHYLRTRKQLREKKEQDQITRMMSSLNLSNKDSIEEDKVLVQ